MLTKLRINFTLAALMTSITMGPAQSQDWPDFLEIHQLFRVIVTGKSRDEIKIGPIKGTAWMAAPGVLITADHVTGKAAKYLGVSNAGKIHIPTRSVRIEFAKTKTPDGTDLGNFYNGAVTPSPFESIDAARIGFIELANLPVTPLLLSACEIEKNTKYRVVKFNGGNVSHPTIVEISLQAYGRSSMGDAGSVVVMKGARGSIVEGDSGSPVLDPDNRVVGLVSAILDSKTNSVEHEVHVTLVRSFLDLIPLQVDGVELLDIPCSERIRLGQIDEIKKQLEELRAENSTLIEQVNALLWNQVRLTRDTERATNEHYPVMPGKNEGGNIWANYKKAAEAGFDSVRLAPLRPTVTRISSALGNPKWSISGSISSKNDVKITLGYERALSGAPYSKNMLFCFNYIVREVPSGTPAEKDPAHRKFYQSLEGAFDSEDERFLLCDTREHTAPNTTDSETDALKKGEYSWTLDKGSIIPLKRLVRQLHPYGAWDGTSYMQIYEPYENDEGQPMYRLHTRAFVDLIKDKDDPENNGKLPCRIYKDRTRFFDAVDDEPDMISNVSIGETCF